MATVVVDWVTGATNGSDDEAITICTAVLISLVVLPLETTQHAVSGDAAARSAGAETGLDLVRPGLLKERQTTKLATKHAIVRKAHDERSPLVLYCSGVWAAMLVA